jgi:hypothetical protein
MLLVVPVFFEADCHEKIMKIFFFFVEKAKTAKPGSRTRITCLEGRHTTAVLASLVLIDKR